MWKLHAIRFAAFLALMVAAVTVNTMVNGPRPTEAAPMADDRPIAGETAMQSLTAEPRYTADGKYIGTKAVKAKPHKAKAYKVKHHSKPKKSLHHSTRHRHLTHRRAPHGHVSAPTSHHKAKSAPKAAAHQQARVRSGADKTPMTLAEKKERCTPDVIRLCAAEIPNRAKIVACLHAHRSQLSKACAVVFADALSGRHAAHDATLYHMRS